MSVYLPSEQMIGRRIAGLTIKQWLDSNTVSSWFEVAEDAGERRLLYLYIDASERDRARLRIHGFRTTIDETLDIDGKATRVFGIIGDYRLMMSSALRAALSRIDTRPPEILGYEIDEVSGHGYKGVTFKVRRAGGVGTPYALKVVLAEEYPGGSYLPEAERMAELAARDRDHFPQIHEVREWTFPFGGQQHSLVVFVEDFIAGNTLAEFLDRARPISVRFLEAFLREILGALKVLYDLDLMHDDLHAGNVMIHESLAGARPYIIDFGSMKRRRPTRKVRDDIRNFAMHVAAVANRIYAQEEARSHYDDTVLAACGALLAEMSDDDPMRRPEDPGVLLEEFDIQFTRGSVKQMLVRPFDFGNAEEVMDNELLQKLAAKSFPWREQIESSANMLVIGPRGCGKTTVFRSMSFTCIADGAQIEEALRRAYVGLYISCNKNFRQRFSSLRPDVLSQRGDEVRHYFGLLVVRELIAAVLACWQERRVSEAEIAKLKDFLTKRARIVIEEEGQGGERILREIETALARGIHSARMAISEGRGIPEALDQGFIADLARFVTREMAAFHGKVLYLFVDDYTERKVPREVQRALNHLLFVPNSDYKTKISSEVFGVAADQTFGLFLDQDRDYKEWNLGTLFYLNLPSSKQKSFLEEIVDNRLALCGYVGRVKDIVGGSTYAEGSLARTLKVEAEARAEARRRRTEPVPSTVLDAEVEREIEQVGKKTYYHGWDTICDLCTGDISNILEVLGRTYDECGVSRTTTSQIAASRQDAVIQGYSLQYINKIKGIPNVGDKLFEIIDAFGNMAAEFLREYGWIDRGEGRKDPYQLLRVELDEALTRSAEEELDLFTRLDRPGGGDPTMLWMLLQRHSILVDADESRSRRNTLANKVVLRRIFCPAFRIGLVNSESFTVDKARWAGFCADPKGTAERYVRYAVTRSRGKVTDAQMPLFRPEGA